MSYISYAPTMVPPVNDDETFSPIWLQWFLSLQAAVKQITSYPLQAPPTYQNPVDVETKEFDAVWLQWFLDIAALLDTASTPLQEPPTEESLNRNGAFNPLWRQWFADLVQIINTA